MGPLVTPGGGVAFDPPPSGTFCWLDLAASDAMLARRFYAQAFGWTFRDEAALGGHFTRCHAGDHEIGSLYQMYRAQVERGVPSHWTPYIRVHDVEAGGQRVAAAGGSLGIAPFDVPGIARIALAQDAVGALIGLWRPWHEAGHEDGRSAGLTAE
jgi:hypothetical protein